MSCSVVVATRGRRPAQLAVLRRALDAQAEPPGGFEVVVVDDSAQRGPSIAQLAILSASSKCGGIAFRLLIPPMTTS